MWSRRRSCFLTTRRGLELSFSYMVKVYWFMESNGPLDLFYPLGSSDLFQGSITYSKYFPRAFHLNSIVLHCNSIQFYYKKKLHNVGLLQKNKWQKNWTIVLLMMKWQIFYPSFIVSIYHNVLKFPYKRAHICAFREKMHENMILITSSMHTHFFVAWLKWHTHTHTHIR